MIDPTTEILLHMIRTRKPKAALDVGEGSAAFVKAASEFLPDIRIDDCSYPDLVTGEIPAKPGVYDLIVCRDLAGRVSDPSGLLDSIRAILKDEGITILTVPNAAHWRSRWDLLRGRLPNPGAGSKTKHRFTESSLTALIEKAGLMPLLRTKPPKGTGALAAWKPSLFGETLFLEAGKLASTPKKQSKLAVPTNWNL